MAGSGRSERALKHETFHIESYGAPLLLCSDYVPPRVLSGMLCRGPRSEYPECAKVDPCRRLPPKLLSDYFSR